MDTTYIILITCVLCVGALLIWLRWRHQSTQRIEEQPMEVTTSEPRAIRSPLEGVSFEDALAVTPMWNGIQKSSEELLVRQFADHLGDGMIATTNAVRFVQQTGEYVVEFSDRGKQLLQVGKATLMRSKDTGRMVPTLLDVNGKIIENAREVGKLKAVAGKMASLTSFVVGAAHIISGADVAKTVRIVGRDVKFLIEGRKNEHLGEFEAAFRTAKLRLGQAPSEANTAQLRGVMHKTAALRAMWRRDLETKLKNIQNPKDSSFLKRLFSRQRSTDRRLASDILPLFDDIELIEASLVLEIGIAQMIGDAEPLFLHVLPDELKLLRQTSNLLSEKAGYIASADTQVASVNDALSQLIDRLSNFVPRDRIPNGVALIEQKGNLVKIRIAEE